MAAEHKAIRCFCSILAKRTDDNIFVCGRYPSSFLVCLFHLHQENRETYYQSNLSYMPFDCDKCLATIKIHSKTYIAPCRIPSIRCDCNTVATFHQAKKDNSNYDRYFLGCSNWRVKRCDFFHWAHEFKTTRDMRILGQLIPTNLPEKLAESCKRPLDQDNDDNNLCVEELRRKFECTICFSKERNYMTIPCNHICCCSTCASRIEKICPICSDPIVSIQRIFFS